MFNPVKAKRDRRARELSFMKELIEPAIATCQMVHTTKFSSVMDTWDDHVRWLVIVDNWHISATLRCQEVELTFAYGYSGMEDVSWVTIDNFTEEFCKMLGDCLEGGLAGIFQRRLNELTQHVIDQVCNVGAEVKTK